MYLSYRSTEVLGATVDQSTKLENPEYWKKLTSRSSSVFIQRQTKLYVAVMFKCVSFRILQSGNTATTLNFISVFLGLNKVWVKRPMMQRFSISDISTRPSASTRFPIKISVPRRTSSQYELKNCRLLIQIKSSAPKHCACRRKCGTSRCGNKPRGAS